MSCHVRRIAAVGQPRIVVVTDSAASLQSAIEYERPGGVYAAFGTWHDHRVIRLGNHFDRFVDSASRVGFELQMDRNLVREELCAILRATGLSGARFRVSVHPDDLNAGDPAPLRVAVEPYDGPPAELRENGVACRTTEHSARANPGAKQTSWLADRARLPGHPYEWLLLDDEDSLVEGASSNFYAVVSGELRTAGTGVLFGIARSIVLEVAPGVVPVRLDPPRRTEIRAMSEAFISSASRGIVPVVTIDDEPIASGRPGELTRELIDRYDRRALELEEPICAPPDGVAGRLSLH